MTNPLEPQTRKIIHVDMDCFYAAIEIRDNPTLQDQPVAVGGSAKQRGVLCTCNYKARQYGVRSAMATSRALRLCPDLIVLPVNMNLYREVARCIHAIFHEFTDLVEPLALDEAYLDVTHSRDFQGSATLIAQAIRQRIWQTQQLTASAGVAPNKFLAKIASGWKKPNGLFVIPPQQVQGFVHELAVDELFGVGKVTAEKLHQLKLKTCADLQKCSLTELTQWFGKRGQQFYEQCRGIDHRSVEPNRVRKSLSVEQTFVQDIHDMKQFSEIIQTLYTRLIRRLNDMTIERRIKSQFVKIKYYDFKLATAEISGQENNLECFHKLFHECYEREKKPLRLIGIGVHFANPSPSHQVVQHDLFESIPISV